MRNALILMILAACMLPRPAVAQGRSTDHVPGQLLAQTRIGADAAAVARALRSNGASSQKQIPQIGVHVLQVPEPALESLRQALLRTGLFTFVERDPIYRPTATPSDPNFSSQWHLAKLQTAAAWDLGKGASV